MKNFQFLSGDINWQTYGAKWYKQVDDTTYHIIELINMWDATGEEDQDKYAIELVEIDLSNYFEKQLDEAISCCGWSDEQIDNMTPLMLLESCHDYGYGAPMGFWSGNNYSKLLKSAKDESNRLSDNDYHENRMNRSVRAGEWPPPPLPPCSGREPARTSADLSPAVSF